MTNSPVFWFETSAQDLKPPLQQLREGIKVEEKEEEAP